MSVAFDVASTGSDGASTISHTCTGDNRLLVVFIAEWRGSSASQVTGVTYNGAALTKLGQAYNTGLCSFWYLVTPDAGTHDIVITAGEAFAAVAMSFTGVDQSVPLTGGLISNIDTDFGPFCNLSGSVGDMAIDGLAVLTGETETPGPSQTQQGEIAHGNPKCTASTAPGGPAVLMQWTLTGDARRAQLAINVRAKRTLPAAMDVRQQAGIRNRIYIAGKTFLRDPAPIQITPQRFETKTRLSNLALRVDRAFILDGMPNIRQRHEINLPWADLREPGFLEYVDLVCAVGQPFDVGLWKQVYDVFDGDGSTKTFYLQRRLLLPAVTPGIPYPDYPTRIFRYDKPLTDPAATATAFVYVSKDSASIDSGTPSPNEAWFEEDGHLQGNLWLTKFRLGTAPASDHDVLLVAYLPRYSMVVDAEQPRSYGIALQEPRGIRLVEFG